MASLRKRPIDDVAAAPVEPVKAAPPVATNVDASPPVTTPAPAPAPLPEVTAPPEDQAQLALKKQIDAMREAGTRQQQAAAAALAAQERRQAWLEATPAAQENYSALGELHNAALRSGLVDTSPAYFEFLETQLANLTVDDMLTRAAQHREPDPPPPRPAPRAANIVSAPVSREIPTGDGYRPPGKVMLTPQHLEAANPTEYGRQLLKPNEMKRNGEYSGQR
jgi:hypothetical protein